MRLIIEIDNEQELKQAQSFLASLPIVTADIQTTKQQKLNEFLDWCDNHLFTVEDSTIPSREERNAR